MPDYRLLPKYRYPVAIEDCYNTYLWVLKNSENLGINKDKIIFIGDSYSPTQWTERFFNKEVNAQNHVMIFNSKTDDGCWLHTRGMAEFGRPDIGSASELVRFAKEKADMEGIPLLFDTDMKAYAEMYQHFGCELYNSVKADNGVTRYSLCYRPDCQ